MSSSSERKAYLRILTSLAWADGEVEHDERRHQEHDEERAPVVVVRSCVLTLARFSTRVRFVLIQRCPTN